MVYTEKTMRAMLMCFEAHKNQTDKSGVPYVFHPFHVAEQMDDEDSVVVALLHDVIEDSPLTLNDVRAEGFGEVVVEALRLLTHDASVPYRAYIEQIKGNALARKVKIADLIHNSDERRLRAVGERDRARMEKYRAALRMLDPRGAW